jgi:hypothetical protein
MKNRFLIISDDSKNVVILRDLEKNIDYVYSKESIGYIILYTFLSEHNQWSPESLYLEHSVAKFLINNYATICTTTKPH